MRDWIKLVEDAENPGIKLAFDDGMVEMSLNGKKIGWFTVDVTHKAEGCVSIHSNIDHDYRNRGFGKIAYDWVEKWAKSKGLRLIPSDRLSPQAYALWQSRDPSAVADFKMIDWFIDRNGKRIDGLEKLWYSPYAIKKYKLNESNDTPRLFPAIRINGRKFVARNPGATHFDALDLATSGLKPEQAQSVRFDGDNRGFVTERGKWLDRYKAAEYARNFDLFDRASPNWANWMATSPDLSSETPLKEGVGGYTLDDYAAKKSYGEDAVDEEGFYYHGTAKARLPGIRREGLIPSTKSRFSRDAFVGDWSIGKAFVTTSLNKARFYASEASRTNPLLLRIPTNAIPEVIEDHKDTDSYYLESGVPSEAIEMWNGRAWKKI